MQFKDRAEAGQMLANQLSAYANRRDVLVLALPRGGVPVAYEVAKALNAPLDVFLVQKLGVPGCEDLAMGAIASGGFRVINFEVVAAHRIRCGIVERVAYRERWELQRRELLYRGNRRSLDVYDSTVILVDDGIATGATMRAAILALRQQQAKNIVIAVPVASVKTYAQLRPEVEEIFCLLTPKRFYALRAWYDNFPAIADQQVQQMLELANQSQLAA